MNILCAALIGGEPDTRRRRASASALSRSLVACSASFVRTGRPFLQTPWDGLLAEIHAAVSS
ncbi:hypothetical protein G5C60_21485 [Streptomyces sp. HC44]|uniref:Uncharacterized protein n=1 Tax=Streptomyces scabichelini TaxID=2711217 RepID=A0A6G4V7L7_9ACTN|nr:hypothetical protein [Streptomyces scabichelini]NGO10092.1 hypothetical protein [Streptomyces scabichelini]